MAKECWVCVIGPIEQNKLPMGADFPMRQAVKQAFAGLVGEEAEICASGWGFPEKLVEKGLDQLVSLLGGVLAQSREERGDRK